MLNFWNLIVQSNTFNFAVLVVIFVIVWQKLNFSEKLVSLKNEISDFIEKSKLAKSDAEKKLSDAQKEVSNLDKEIEKELKLANERADNVVACIEKMSKEGIKRLEKNVVTVIDNEARKVNNTLLNDVIDKAILKSEEILKTKFKENPSMHEEYINKSLKIFEKSEFEL